MTIGNVKVTRPWIGAFVYIFVHGLDGADFRALSEAAQDPKKDTEWLVLTDEEARDLHTQLGEVVST